MRLWILAGTALVLAPLLMCATGKLMTRSLETVAHPEAPSDAETHFLETRSGRVHVLDVGEGEHTVLLLHGTGRSVADWQEGLAQLLARKYRVVAIDYYGHGLSDRSHGLSYGIALWARQAVDVLDALEIERVTVVGHSAGGAVAAILSADRPERVSRTVFIGHGMAMDPMQIVPLLPGFGEMRLARTEIFSDIFSADHERRLRDAYAIRGTRAALLVFLRRQYTIDGLRLLTGTYEQIQRPVLQVHGSGDASISIEAGRRLSARLADTRFIGVPGVGHDVHVEAPEALADAIGAFMASGTDHRLARAAGSPSGEGRTE